MPLDLGFCWLMVLLRATGMVALLPTLAGRALPPTVRVGLAVFLAVLLYGIVPHRAIPEVMSTLVSAAVGEVVLGLAMGFIGRLAFSAVELAGRLIANEMGLTAAPGFDVPQPGQEPLAAFLAVFAGVIFFALDAHVGVLTAFRLSFDFAPAGLAGFGPAATERLIHSTGHILELGLRIAAPFIALNFLVNVAFSVLGRAVPRMNVFVLSYSVRLLGGFLLLAGAGALIARYLAVEFNALPFQLLEILPPRR